MQDRMLINPRVIGAHHRDGWDEPRPSKKVRRAVRHAVKRNEERTWRQEVWA